MKGKKIHVLLYFLIIQCLFISVKAQITEIDSLENCLRNYHTEDTIRINLLNEIAYKLYQINIESMHKYANEALEIADKLEFAKGKAESLRIMGIYYRIKGDYPLALEFYQSSLKLFEQLGNNYGIGACLNNIGNIYRWQEIYTQAHQYYQKSLEIKKEIGDERGISLTLNNIGVCLMNEGEYEESLDYLQRSLVIKQGIGDIKSISNTQYNIGNTYVKLGNYAKALEFYQSALKVKELVGERYVYLGTLKGMGFIYYQQGNYALALKKTTKALEMEKDYGFLEDQKDLYKQVSDIYTALNNPAKALENYILHKEISDSIHKTETIKKITALEHDYKHEKEKQALELEQQKQEAIFAAEIKHQKIISIAWIVGFVMMTALALAILFNFIQKRKANRTLTKQKEEIAEKNTELLELNATKDKLFSLVAHDLKSPFSSLLGILEELSENFSEYDDDKKEEYIRYINNVAEKVYKLLENLLTWAQSQIGRTTFMPEKINLESLINEIILLFEESSNNKEISLITGINKGLTVSADRNMIDTVLRNLILNAIKFTSKGGLITIKSRKVTDENNKKFVEISVKDNGVGISSEIQSKLFKVTENITTKGTENEKGSGLGLLICQEFIEKHGGKIWVESKLNKGSKFFFTIPMA